MPHPVYHFNILNTQKDVEFYWERNRIIITTSTIFFEKLFLQKFFLKLQNIQFFLKKTSNFYSIIIIIIWLCYL
jgi:hypothetical protein